MQACAVLAACLCSPVAAATDGALEGRWQAKGGAGTVQIEMEVPAAEGGGQTSFVLTVPRRQVGAAAGRFELVREAGTLVFAGLHALAGGAETSGPFSFLGNPQYAAELARLGFARPDATSLLELAFHEVDLRYAREMAGLGLADLSLQEVGEMKIHGVSPEYVRELASLGYSGLSPERLVELRMHGVRPDCVRTLQQQGRGKASLEELEMLGMHGMGPCAAEEGGAAERQ